MPRAPNSACTLAQTGRFAPGGWWARCSRSACESVVGIQTTRAPSRAAISTANGFIPPIARFSTIAPSAATPGTTPRTTAARSAVDV